MNIIRSDRRSDILKEKSDYEERYNASKQRYDEQYQSLVDARNSITDSVVNHIKNYLGNLVDELNIQVRAEFAFNNSSIEVRVLSNDVNVNDESKALSWNYDVSVNKEGEVVRESGSWSGLNAVTAEQIDSLKKTVRALEILNELDWDQLVKQEGPSWGEYMTEENPDRIQHPNFDEELRQLDLEEAIGTNKLFKATEGKLYRGPVYYRINRVSGIRYYLTEYPARRAEQGDFSEHADTTLNYNTLMQYLITPYQTVEATE